MEEGSAGQRPQRGQLRATKRVEISARIGMPQIQGQSIWRIQSMIIDHSKLHHLAGAQDAVDVRKIVRRGDMRAGFGRVAFPVEARQIQNRHRHIRQDAIAKSDDFYLAGAKGFPAASPPGY